MWFIVTLPNLNYKRQKNVGVNVGVNVGIKLTKTEQRILELLSENKEISAEEMAAALHVTRRTVERHLASLKKNGIIERVGSNKNGFWKINDIADRF